MTVAELIDLLSEHDPTLVVGVVYDTWYTNIRMVTDLVQCDVLADEDSNILRIVTPGQGATRMLIIDVEKKNL